MLNVAIDGPGGAGKSSVAKAVARQKGLMYLDTGALYRSIGLALSRQGIDLDDEEAIKLPLSKMKVRLDYTEEGKQLVYVDGEELSPFIRTAQSGQSASKVAVHGCVREKLLNIQRHTGEVFDVIMDGRDIGTVVLPHADLKIFITASCEERARRRYEELDKAGSPHGTMEEMVKEIAERDYRDSHREIAPLKQAEDAVLLDTTEMDLDEVIAKVGELIDKAAAKKKTAEKAERA